MISVCEVGDIYEDLQVVCVCQARESFIVGSFIVGVEALMGDDIRYPITLAAPPSALG